MTKTRFLIAVTVLSAAAGACDDDEPMAPDTGTLEVSVATTGDGTDEDGYTVSLDEGTEEEDVAVDGTVAFDVDPGQHTVELTDVADGCTVDGDNPVTVTVEASDTESVSFGVTCTDGG